MEKIFDNIFNNKIWGSTETVSGPGSTVIATSVLRNYFTQNNNIKICDIPCGDMNWMRLICDSFDKYYGIDIVTEIANKNKSKFETNKALFDAGDICTIDFSKMDIDTIFTRDCLVHFSLEDILRALNNITKSNAKYLMMTHFDGDRPFRDIVTGDWRPINFRKEPFNFPIPNEIINEGCLEGDGIFADKSIAKWAIDDIRKSLQKMNKYYRITLI